jgi:hypothetical protein
MDAVTPSLVQLAPPSVEWNTLCPSASRTSPSALGLTASAALWTTSGRGPAAENWLLTVKVRPL